MQIVVQVLDVNDNYPIVSVNTLSGTSTGSSTGSSGSTRAYRASVPENSDAGSFVAHISVYDADTGPSGQASLHRQIQVCLACWAD